MHNIQVLPTGLRIVTSEMAHMRSASIAILVGTGSRYERDEQAGLSHFVEHMLFKGTQRRPTAKDINGVIESVGGDLDAFTDKEFTLYSCKVVKGHFSLALDVLADMIRNPIHSSGRTPTVSH